MEVGGISEIIPSLRVRLYQEQVEHILAASLASVAAMLRGARLVLGGCRSVLLPATRIV